MKETNYKTWWKNLNQSQQVIFTIKYFNLAKQHQSLKDEDILKIYNYER